MLFHTPRVNRIMGFAQKGKLFDVPSPSSKMATVRRQKSSHHLLNGTDFVLGAQMDVAVVQTLMSCTKILVQLEF